MKQIRRLTKADFDDLTPRKKGDGNNIFLVTKKRSEGLIRYLAFIYDFDGKPHEISRGSATWDNLKKQRPLAAKARALLDQKPPVDPITILKPATAAPANTFASVGDELIDRQVRKGAWKSAKHERQWRQTLADLPKTFRDRPVNQIDAKMVYEAFAPIWDLKSATARRTLGRVREVIDFAREHDDARVNPATWSGWLKNKLGDPSPMKRDRKTGEQIHRDNHAAMRWQDAPKLVEKLKNDGDVSALALIFAVLTGLRASEARKAKWERVRLRRPNAHHPVERAQDWQENENLSHYSVVGGGAGCAQENDGDTVGRLRLHGPPRRAAIGEHALRGAAPPRADRHRAWHALGLARLRPRRSESLFRNRRIFTRPHCRQCRRTGLSEKRRARAPPRGSRALGRVRQPAGRRRQRRRFKGGAGLVKAA